MVSLNSHVWKSFAWCCSMFYTCTRCILMPDKRGAKMHQFEYELLPPTTKLGQGYVFTGVCDSVHGGGGSTWPGTPPGPGTPPRTRYTPPGPGTPPRDQVHPPGPGTAPRTRYTPQTRYTPPGPGTPPRTRYTPPGPGTPPGTRYTPQTRYPPRDQVHSLDQVHPLGQGTPPRPGTPLDQVHPPGTRYNPPGPGTPPGTKDSPPGHNMLGDTVYARAVRILLECNLVSLCLYFGKP